MTARRSRPPRAARWIVRVTAPEHRVEDLLGDLEEAHRGRVGRMGRAAAAIVTSLEALDISFSTVRSRRHPDRAERPRRRPRQALRDNRPSLLDFKLGVRMLVKYPGLTIVGGLSIAFGTAVSAGAIEFITDVMDPVMPFEQGERLVEIRYHDLRTYEGLDRRALHDYEVWRDELRTVSEIGAFVSYNRNLLTERTGAVPVYGAAMTAVAFGLPRVPPLLGRPLTPDDERPGAPGVIVIGEDVWQTHFGRDPDVLGRTARLGGEVVTVVGVMPADFGWPWAQEVWTPFRERAVDFAWGEGPGIQVAARLAPGASRKDLRAELATLTAAITADHPEMRGHVRADVVGYGAVPMGMDELQRAGLFSAFVFFGGALVVLVCSNVALLLFARTAARQSEIVVRGALGASRGRIVSQLFVEALLLGTISSLLGLWAAGAGLSWFMKVLDTLGEDVWAFWHGGAISPGVAVGALLMSLVAASLAGVVPALRLTQGGVQSHLQKSSTGGSNQDFGRLWTGVIVTQIAVTVAFVPIAIFFVVQTASMDTATYGVPANEYLTAELGYGGDWESLRKGRGPIPDGDALERYRASRAELKRRLEREPGVRAVTITAAIPGGPHTDRWFEFDPADGLPRSRAPLVPVDLDFFTTLDAAVLSGRDFSSADLEAGDGDSGDRVAIVNPEFVRRVLEGRNPIGRRIAFNPWDQEPGEPNPGPWYEIVGVVEQLAVEINPESPDHAAIYVPLGPDRAYPARIAIRTSGDPTGLAPTLRDLALDIDPGLIVDDVRPMSESAWATELAWSAFSLLLVGSSLVGLLLSTAGIYAIMSFTVSRRTREIGVRVALGADRRRIALNVFGRGLRQVLAGTLIGGIVFATATRVFFLDVESSVTAGQVALLFVYLVAMAGVCSIACVVPTRRALSVEPTEALRAEG